MNASNKNQSLGTIKCGELPNLHKDGLNFEELEIKKYINAGNHHFHLLTPLGWGCAPNALMRSHMY